MSRLLAGLLRLTSGLAENIPAGPTGGRSPAGITARITSRSGICPRLVGARFVSVDSGLFVPNPSTDVGCQGDGNVLADDNVTVNGNVTVRGNVTVSGAKHAAVAFPDGTHRVLYCRESPGELV